MVSAFARGYGVTSKGRGFARPVKLLFVPPSRCALWRACPRKLRFLPTAFRVVAAGTDEYGCLRMSTEYSPRRHATQPFFTVSPRFLRTNPYLSVPLRKRTLRVSHGRQLSRPCHAVALAKAEAPSHLSSLIIHHSAPRAAPKKPHKYTIINNISHDSSFCIPRKRKNLQKRKKSCRFACLRAKKGVAGRTCGAR